MGQVLSFRDKAATEDDMAGPTGGAPAPPAAPVARVWNGPDPGGNATARKAQDDDPEGTIGNAKARRGRLRASRPG